MYQLQSINIHPHKYHPGFVGYTSLNHSEQLFFSSFAWSSYLAFSIVVNVACVLLLVDAVVVAEYYQMSINILGFYISYFSVFLHHFVLTKLATSSESVNALFGALVQDTLLISSATEYYYRMTCRCMCNIILTPPANLVLEFHSPSGTLANRHCLLCRERGSRSGHMLQWPG